MKCAKVVRNNVAPRREDELHKSGNVRKTMSCANVVQNNVDWMICNVCDKDEMRKSGTKECRAPWGETELLAVQKWYKRPSHNKLILIVMGLDVAPEHDVETRSHGNPHNKSPTMSMCTQLRTPYQRAARQRRSL